MVNLRMQKMNLKGCEHVAKNRKRCRKIIISVLAFVLLVSLTGAFLIDRSIPDRLQVVSGDRKSQILRYPFDTIIEENVAKAASQNGSNIPQDNLNMSAEEPYTIECKLFGVIPVKNIQVDVVERSKVIPCGSPVGIYMKTRGILVVGTGAVNGMDGVDYEPAASVVQSGDYILGVNGNPISDKKELISRINESGGSDITLEVQRKGEITDLKVTPVMTGTSEYKTGIWVRDDTQGIGTMTYVDENGNYGALGHGISDVDTSTLLSLQEGKLYPSDIISVVKGEKGVPGELAGVIRYDENEVMGSITANTEAGIFGKVTDSFKSQLKGTPIEVGLKQEIETGPATILCTVDGTVKEYDIEIEKVLLNSSDVNKSMVIKVTDEELLQKTGGIVQGMSGSPIIQNGKLIGAVTHVFIQDSTSGFGIFAENMIFVDS